MAGPGTHGLRHGLSSLAPTGFRVGMEYSLFPHGLRHGPHFFGPAGPCGGAARRKKRVSNFDQQSHYVTENKGSGKRTKPNKANFVEVRIRRLGLSRRRVPAESCDPERNEGLRVLPGASPEIFLALCGIRMTTEERAQPDSQRSEPAHRLIHATSLLSGRAGGRGGAGGAGGDGSTGRASLGGINVPVPPRTKRIAP